MSAPRSLRSGKEPPTGKLSPARTPAVGAPYRLAVLACFFCSGVSALAYEVVWVRMLTLIFGATTLGVGTVLASYMAGLALGSWFWSGRADRADRPFRLYAQLELGVAIAALLTPLLFVGLQAIYRSLFAGGLSDFSALSLVRFILCFPALIIPTFLMGGTLPLLARFYTTSSDGIGRGSGDLYAVNTLGAVTGSVLTGFCLIPTLGVHGALIGAVCLNAAIALVAWRLSASVQSAPPVEVAPSSQTRNISGALVAVMVGFGVSGFAAMIFEITWTRALILIFGNSTYAFTTMLASFLVGLALGAALAGRLIDRATHPYFVFASLQILIGASAAAATPWIQWLPSLFLKVYAQSGGSFYSLQTFQFVACCLLMLPTTIGLGAMFPVTSKIFSSHAEGAGRSVGLPYAANTLGTVLGAVTTGFFLLPHLGIEKSIAIGTLLNLLVWAAVFLTHRETVLKPIIVAAMPLLAILAAARLLFIGLDPRVLSAGVYMYPEYFLGMERHNTDVQDSMQRLQALYYREGYSTSVAVLRAPTGDLVLRANGKTDASTGDLSTQRALAHLPMLLKPGAKTVLVVGLASGCTAGSTLLYPVDRVDCIEIEPAMRDATEIFAHWNHNALQDPRLHIKLQDARNYVMMSREKYDVITAEPTNPWIAGVNNLFTQEYYRHCYDRLEPDGLMCQWMPAYNFSEPELRSALATFKSVFPYVTVWAFPRLRNDFMAIGTKTPLTFNPVSLAARLTPERKRDLQAVGVQDVWQFASGLILDEPATAGFCRGAALDTDERPLLEFSTPRHLYEIDSNAHAMEATYAAGRASALMFNTALAPALLKNLGDDPVVQGRVVQAAFIPHHPANINPFVNAGVDISEVRLVYNTPEGPAVEHAMPLPSDHWPQSLKDLWASASGGSPASGTPGEGEVIRQGVDPPGTHIALVYEVPMGPGATARLQQLVKETLRQTTPPRPSAR